MTSSSSMSTQKRRRASAPPPPLIPGFNSTTSPLLLAAAANLHSPAPRSLIKRALRSHLLLLTTPTPSLPLHHILPGPFLSVLPLLLTSRFPSVSELAVEVIAAAGLYSLEGNSAVVSDRAVVEGLVRVMGRRRSAEAACHAVMDLATSAVGRDRLRDSFALEKLLSLFCQVATTSSVSIFVRSIGEASSDLFISGTTENNLLASLLDAAVILINTSVEDYLNKMPEDLSKQFCKLLKELWDNIRGSTLPCNGSPEQSFLRSRRHDLAITIFRLSMNRGHYETWRYDEIKRNIFGNGESEFKNFIRRYWEVSPCKFRKESLNLEDDAAIFRSLVNTFDPKSIYSSLDSILRGLVSCPPIASDELNILSFLNEVSMTLGSRIMYGQDIRVLKTQYPATGSMQRCISTEVHFFNGSIDSQLIDADYVEKFKVAFQDGYTIALRGMEFRSDKVAAIAEGFADLFGQPSVGANIYLTPPRSQGLAQHYDDHCVFVWQLFGRKNWRVLPRASTLLPRLYEPLGSLVGIESGTCEAMQFSLREGDILYIPRGCPHEAHTPIDENDYQEEGFTTFSLHLTLGIEVEPPFEWEGFAHIALNCWNEKQKQSYPLLTDHKSRKSRVMFINLLHVGVKLIADRDPVFRKACMVAALPVSCNTEADHYAHALLLNEKATFTSIIDTICSECAFTEAFRSIETVVLKKNDDSLQWMKWLRHLPHTEDEIKGVDCDNLMGVFEDLVRLYCVHPEEVIIEFHQVKSAFCKQVNYEDACQSFKMILEKYRKTRKQYMNGMLSLHST